VATAVVQCLVTCIDVSDEEFLAHNSVCVSISELAGSFHGGLDDDYREALMELLFNVATTTKVRRGLLSLWFNLEGMRGREGHSASDLSVDVYRRLSEFSDIRMISRFSIPYWKMSLLKEGLGTLQKQDCCILSSWPTMVTNWKNGYSRAIFRQ
jgi:hypothetical protein